MIRHIKDDNLLYAIIIPANFDEEGLHFVTPDEMSLQMAYMRHPEGKVIAAHYHNQVNREVTGTKEVLFIRNGKVRVDFYDDKQVYSQSVILSAGDIILLVDGGHGFEALEELVMLEVKQGPYGGDHKTRFPSVSPEKIRIN
jgi:mannose-6-phosphate isomerase-like protein (cupin superfamily)